MVGNHVAEIVKRYGEGGDIPRALTDYIEAREGYDYSHHGRAGNPDTEFVPDEIVDRFCVLGTVEDHVAKLRELEGLGVDQFNIYLMHDAMDATLDAYGERGHPGDGRAAREHRQQVADLLIARDGVGQRQLRAQRVVVAPAPALAREVAVGDELADDAVRGALGDPHQVADVAQADAGVAGDAKQDLRVASEERPAGRRKVRHEGARTKRLEATTFWSRMSCYSRWRSIRKARRAPPEVSQRAGPACAPH